MRAVSPTIDERRHVSMQRMSWRDEERHEVRRVVVRAGVGPRATTHDLACGAGLLQAFEERARQLGCSLDWLFAEALRRMLEVPGHEPVAQSEVAHHDGETPTRVRTTAPLPPPVAPPLVAERSRVDAARIQLRTQTAEGLICAAVSHGMVIGRSESEADLLLVHRGVSRKHVRIERREEGWVVVDMASFNGVYVNGVRTRCSPVVPGDVIGIGPFAVTVERG
jgi:hypothetical protein